MIKKWIYTLVVCLILVGCQKKEISKPDQTFREFMQAFKAGELSSLASYLDEPIRFISYDEMKQWVEEDDFEWIQEELNEILRKVDYTIVDVKQVLPEAIVTVRIETKDYGLFIEEIYASLITKYLLSPNSDFKEEALDLIEERLDNFNTSYQKEVKVYMVYNNGWQLDTDKNKSLLEALTGGAYSKIQSFLS